MYFKLKITYSEQYVCTVNRMYICMYIYTYIYIYILNDVYIYAYVQEKKIRKKLLGLSNVA